MPNGQYPYTGVGDCLLKSIKREGVTGLWVGFPTYFFRVGPHAVISLLVLDFFTSKFVSK